MDNGLQPDLVEESSYRILIVEDNLEELLVFAHALSESGFEVLQCTDPYLAQALCREQQPALVLLDILMPGLNGLEVLKQIRSDPTTSQIPVAAISARSDIAMTRAMLEAGAEDYWTKPINLAAFLHWIRQMLNFRRLMTAYQYELAERRQIARQLSESEARWSRILDLVSDGVLMINAEQRITLFSASAERIFGYTAAEIVGQELTVLLPLDARQKHLDLVQTFARLDRDRQRMSPFRDVYGRRQDGSVLPLEVSIGKMDENGQTVFVAMMRDITERKQAEQALRQSEERYRSLFESTSDAVFFVDLNGHYTLVNHQAAQMLGYSREELLGLTVNDVIMPDERHDSDLTFAKLMRGEIVQLYERTLRKKDGQPLPTEVNVALVRDDKGEPMFIQAVVRDISERRQAQQALHQANEQLQQGIQALQARSLEMNLLSKMSEYLQSCQSSEEAYSVIATYMQQFFPFSSGALSVMHPSQKWLEVSKTWGKHPPSVMLFNTDECWALRRSRLHVGGSHEHSPGCAHLAQSVPPAYLCAPLLAQSDVLGVLHLYLEDGPHEPLNFDPNQRQLAQTLADSIALGLANLALRETLRSQSIRDGLTGLYNRRHLEETLGRELHRSSRSGRPVSLAMLDLDRFKLFNDTYGHTAGDALLKALSNLLQTRTRAQDVACRYGGEEFLLIFPDTDFESALHKAELLRQEVAGMTLTFEGQSLGPITISCGVSSTQQHGLEAGGLLQAADEALYQAKRNGRNRVEAARPAAPDT